MDYQLIILMVAVAVASGLMGVFALMRKMTLASDALSHVALPGIGLAIMFKLNPVIGGAVALLLGVLLIWVVERRTSIGTETIVGVTFSASLAIGSLLATGEELVDALFGGKIVYDPLEWTIGILAAVFVIGYLLLNKERLTLALISRDLAVVTGINVSRLDLFFLLVFALNVILGLQFLGVLLMGSLIIVPAAVGRNLGKSLNSTLFISALAAVFSVISGLFISISYGLALGPVIITVATGLFLASLLWARG